MDNIILAAFITGLTAGGLSCFAIQGGLLSGSIAHRLETQSQGNTSQSKANPRPANIPLQAGMIQPILLFMAAKLAAYTLMGFLLGLLGSAFSFSPLLSGGIQLAIGVFLVGNALRMFNVHPIFRIFNFEPPVGVTRYIRKVSKSGSEWITPLYLGALTVLIPCGVTQSVMALAIATGSPLTGSALLFAFVLGTSPTFVGISWLATNLGGLFQKYFLRIVAVITLALGLYALNGGLRLVGGPSLAFGGAPAAVSQNQFPTTSNVVTINVEDYGYNPDQLTLPANQTIELRLVTKEVYSCSRAFVIPSLKVMEMLPATGEVAVQIPAQAAGTTMQFMCSMGMYGGVMKFQ